MAILGKLIKGSLKLKELLPVRKKNPIKMQKRVLLKLLFKAQNTKFGQKFDFFNILEKGLLANENTFFESYQNNVPVFDYDSIFENWWYMLLKGEKNVTWPGKIKYFALSSGTSGSPSKHIPVSKEMIKAIHRSSIRQMIALSSYKAISADNLDKGYLMLGGSIDLTQINNDYFEGDLSGITAGKMPVWFEKYYKPGREIASTKNWEEKLEKITQKAKDWDISFLVGVPAWIQLLVEKIIKEYNLNNIHEIWPNLTAFTHGGVSMEPYKHSFEKLLGKPISYIETYLASEGFLAYQPEPESDMQLVLNNGIFFEFIPFNDDNFDSDGNLLKNVNALLINQVVENEEYAILISTVAGAWRYLIGDTIKFTNVAEFKIKITGRTKHFLSLCGEHLSVDNMTKAIEMASEHFKADFREFTVFGKKEEDSFSHNWFVGSDTPVNELALAKYIDQAIGSLNDDYIVERQHALKFLNLKVLPVNIFYKFLEKNNKFGGQNKFPRVLKQPELIADWVSFIN